VPDYALQRRMMIDGQLRTYDVTQSRVIDAFSAVPRELFVNPADQPLAYVDRTITVGEGAGRRPLLAPMVLGRLLQTAEIGADDVALDVACATGYSSAVLARLAASVVALETDAGLAARARHLLDTVGVANAAVVTGPISDGCPAEAPYDVIVVNGSFEEEPGKLLAQLRDGGRLVGVLGSGRAGRAMLYLRSGKTVSGRSVFDAAAPALPEFRSAPAFVF
jgi:protein-L-isoaspartate(D-aspartate) O-methyltransferase